MADQAQTYNGYCVKCKEKMKKRALKVKKRFKLVQPSSVAAAKAKVAARAPPAQRQTPEGADGGDSEGTTEGIVG